MRAVGLVILAAGASTRLGRPKQLLPYRGRTLLRHAAQVALDSVCRPVVVVLGAWAEQLEPEVRGLPVHVAHNPHWEDGMGASLRAGLRALEATISGVEAAVVLLCDQPFVSARTIDALVEARHATGRPIIASEYGGALGVPCLFDRALFGELAALQGAEGAKRVIKGHEDDVVGIPFPAGAIDIDTPADYEQLRAGDSGAGDNPQGIDGTAAR